MLSLLAGRAGRPQSQGAGRKMRALQPGWTRTGTLRSCGKLPTGEPSHVSNLSICPQHQAGLQPHWTGLTS